MRTRILNAAKPVKRLDGVVGETTGRAAVLVELESVAAVVAPRFVGHLRRMVFVDVIALFHRHEIARQALLLNLAGSGVRKQFHVALDLRLGDSDRNPYTRRGYGSPLYPAGYAR